MCVCVGLRKPIVKGGQENGAESCCWRLTAADPFQVCGQQVGDVSPCRTKVDTLYDGTTMNFSEKVGGGSCFGGLGSE